MQIDYTALRSIQAGHSASTAYTINVDLSQADRMPDNKLVQNVALNGNTVTTIHALKTKYSITTSLIDTTTTPTLSDMREFLDSVKAGESFTSDISGATVSYRILNPKSPYSENREGQAYFRYSFQIIEA